MIELQLCGRSPILCDQSNRLKCFGRNASIHIVPICDRFRLLVTLFFSLSSSSFSFFSFEIHFLLIYIVGRIMKTFT